MEMNKKLAYQTLGLTSPATQDEVKQRYHQLMKIYHPDLNNGKGNTTKLNDANNAYKYLSGMKIEVFDEKKWERQRRDKHAAFQRLSKARLEQTLEEIRKIGNLANEANYEYTRQEVEQLFASLESALKKTRNMFNV